MKEAPPDRFRRGLFRLLRYAAGRWKTITANHKHLRFFLPGL